jgi:type I restriction enzyme R subunit
MKSLNFDQLNKQHPALSEAGLLIEKYVYSDPKGAVFHARNFLEYLVKAIYKAYNQDYTSNSNFFDLLSSDFFITNTPKSVLDKFHLARKLGNSSVHGDKTTSDKALLVLKQVYDLSKWFALIHLGIKDYVEYSNPIKETKNIISAEELKKEKDDQIEKLKAEIEKLKENQLQKVSFEENTRIVSEELKYNEDETRKELIDLMIAEAGWNIKYMPLNLQDREEISKFDTDQVKREVEIDNQPTSSGLGYIDYCLYDKNGTILAVIEAKRTSVDVNKGKEQARIYADAVEKKQGYRPVIFYTNGFETKLWDDANKYPPRTVWGIYSHESLTRLIHQRGRTSLENAKISDIAGRDYQLSAIRAVANKFTKKKRKALIVLATGTGKTRVAISLTKFLQENNWCKKILFLCDRKELIKQAKNNFTTHLGENTTAVVKSTTIEDARNARICFATYPSMLNSYTNFDIGHFDLIIADESHRSIYNIYGDIFKYFDAYQVGLTATPVGFISRNTFDMFDCDETMPTAYYPLDKAIEDGNLVDYMVIDFKTKFMRDGIKYNEFTEEQKKEVEARDYLEEELDYEDCDINKTVFNKSTSSIVIKNLFENGLKDENCQTIGKTIIFCRTIEHAKFMQDLIDELYPQYGGRISAVIASGIPRAEALIDEFKEPTNPMKIAISVDMLDTGVDVPEVVNLVFDKPVKSKVKFEQMIGRGTRLCSDLFGKGKDKTCFKIFDHWGNFEYFAVEGNGLSENNSKSLMQRMFETYIDIAVTADIKHYENISNNVKNKITEMLSKLNKDSISVKEKYREIAYFSDVKNLNFRDEEIRNRLRSEIASLMQWVDIGRDAEIIKFDYLISNIQNALINAKSYDAYQIDLVDKLNSLPANLTQVKEKQVVIDDVTSPTFWEGVTFDSLENVRVELRELANLFTKDGGFSLPSKKLDITESEEDIFANIFKGRLPQSMKNYDEKIKDIVARNFHNNFLFNKIKNGERLTQSDFDKIIASILTQDPLMDKIIIKEFFSNVEDLEKLLLSICGVTENVVKQRFSEFLQHYTLSDIQNQFLMTLQNFIINNNGIKIADIYEAPFNSFTSDGVEGLFENEALDEICEIIDEFPIKEVDLERQVI